MVVSVTSRYGIPGRARAGLAGIACLGVFVALLVATPRSVSAAAPAPAPAQAGTATATPVAEVLFNRVRPDSPRPGSDFGRRPGKYLGWTSAGNEDHSKFGG